MTELRRLLGYMRPYVGRVVFASILLAIAGGLMAAVLGTFKPLVNEVFGVAGPEAARAAAGSAASDASILSAAKRVLPLDRLASWARGRAYVEVPLVLLVLFFVRAVLLYGGQYVILKSGASVVRDIRADLYESIAFQSLRVYQAHPTGLILSRVLHDVSRLQGVATIGFVDFIRVASSVPFVVALVLWQDWRLATFSLVTLPALAVPMIRLSRRLRGAATRSQETMAEAASLLAETVGGARVVQAFSMERFEVRRFRAALDRMLGADLKAARVAALAPAVMELFGGAAGAAIFFVAGWEVSRGRLTGGDVTVVFAGLGYLFMSLRRLNYLNSEFQQAIAAARRVFEMKDRESEIKDAPGARPLPPFEGAIAFEGVDFRYEDELVLREIDLRIRKGEVIALVGASGSGKSTLASLVMRYYDPVRGRVTIDGQDLRDATLASLRGQIGLVTQETVLFNESVRANIAYGRDDVPLARIVDAARAAQALEFIESLPLKWDTVLGERGARLSMGQRQRIAIARALLKDPPILILDEATSALDSESESLVQKALEELMKGRTSIVIAHRLATVRRAARILVVEGGRIVEEGDHRDLLDRGGAYAKLHAIQFLGSGG